MNKYPLRLQEQIDMLEMFPDRADRIDALVALGSRYDAAQFADVPRAEANRVPGCESEVYLSVEPMGLGLRFKFAVDNPQGISAMALAQLLDEGLSGEALEQVADVSEDLVFEVFGRELSMGKSMGLTGMVRMVRAQAAGHLLKERS